MKIDFVKCESERPRSETCGAKSETQCSVSFPSNHRPGTSRPKQQSAAKRTANSQLLATASKQEDHVQSVFILKLEGFKFLPPRYFVRQGFAQASARSNRKQLQRYTCHFITWSPTMGRCLDPLL